MYFDDLLKRTNLYALEIFLLEGGESYVKPSEKTYEQQLKDAHKNIMAFLKCKYADLDEYDEVLECFNQETEVCKNVYFEIGLLLGAKIAVQIQTRMEELK